MDAIGSGMDKETAYGNSTFRSTALLGILKKQGLDFLLSSKVNSITESKASGGIEVSVESASEQARSLKFTSDAVLISVGRTPCTDDLGLAVCCALCHVLGCRRASG